MFGMSDEEFVNLFTLKSWYRSHRMDHLLDPLDLQLMDDGKVSVSEVEQELEERRKHDIQAIC